PRVRSAALRMLNIAVEHAQIKSCACSTDHVRNKVLVALSMLNRNDRVGLSPALREVDHAQIRIIAAPTMRCACEILRDFTARSQTQPARKTLLTFPTQGHAPSWSARRERSTSHGICRRTPCRAGREA